KGVLVSHRAIVNRILWMQEEFCINETDAVLQKTPFSFDVSVWEFFWPLMQGAQLVVAAPDAHKDAKALQTLIDRHSITTMHFVPSMLNLFLAAMPKGACNSLRQVFCSGEALSCDTQDQFYSLISADLVNLYGPTEAAVDVTYWRCDPNENRRSVPIGRPIANTQIYILDQAGQPVPSGVAGELMISGMGLARGYHNKPDLTLSKFIDNPFDSHSRLYKTGDLARYNNEGVIEFLGRIDNQVKIRGFRIELDEIEQVARSYSGVIDVVVIAKQRSEEDKVIMAWAVCENDADADGLREYLESQLPYYMVPSYITVIDAVPLTANGKADLKVLLEMTVTNDQQLPFVAPRNRMERFICEQWLEAIASDDLALAQLGIDDDLFHAGGHSLTAVRLVTRISDKFSLDVPLQSVFRQSTPRKLSNWITSNIMELKGGGSIDLSSTNFSSFERSGLWALSFAQERLWFLEKMQSGTTLFNISVALKLDGPLDELALAESLQAMVDRHDILRTVFVEYDGIPFQKIADSADATIDWITLDEKATTGTPIVPSSLLADKIALLARQDQDMPFNIETGPLYRFSLLPINDKQHIIFVSFHHLISDGWSLDVFIKEFSVCYAAYSRSDDIVLDELSLSYAQYSTWHRQKIESGAELHSLEFWKKTLADAPPLLEFPWDRTRPSRQTTHGSSLPFTIDAGLVARLKSIRKQGSRKESSSTDASLFVLLLTGLNILLSRYSQQNDIVIGTAVANRDYSQTESILGLFVNSLAIRTKIDGELSFFDFLHQVGQNFLSAFEHRELPFEKVVEQINVDRNLSYTPVFQTMLVLQNASDDRVALSGLDVTVLPVQSTSAKFDLSFILQESLNSGSLEELNGIIEFNTDLFDADSVREIMASYLTLLEAICDSPENSIASYSLVSKQTERKLKMDWSGVQTDYPRESTVHDYFSEIVKDYGSNIAIREVRAGLSSQESGLPELASRELTYLQLDQQADQVAQYLLSMGVSTGHCVGICIERSSFLIVAILGVLKAGAAFVPLDASYPKTRLQFIVDDTNAQVVINSRSTSERLALDESVTTLTIDGSEWKNASAQQQAEVKFEKKVEAKFDDPAYIMHTSGSTGNPKGVVISHRAILRLVVNNNYYAVSDDDKFLQYAPISFDASTFEIWGALLNGACLVVAPAGNLPLHQLGQLVREQQISTLLLTSNLFNVMVDDFPKDLLKVKQLLTGGEAISTKHMRRALNTLPETKLINGYGPTENATFTSVYQIPADHDDLRPVPIGKPVANSTVFILEDNLNLVPIGMPGELYTGGDGLSSGYWGRADLTRDNFVENPHGSGKLYKTGDRARWLPNGTIEYLGRVDDQLKIRGFRIEPGEIETVLNSLRRNDTSLVAQCAVAARELPHGGKVLVAWICLPAGVDNASVDESLLQSLLEAQLPAFMVPSHIVVLPELPLTNSGKLDRNALLFDANNLQKLGGEKVHIEPVTALEKKMAGIWQNLLHIDSIGLADSFFELGGHSLLATQLVSRVRTLLQIDVPINTIFENPSLDEYCRQITRLESALSSSEEKLSGSSSAIVKLGDSGRKELSFAQERLWFLDQLEPGNPFYNISVALCLTGCLDRAALQSSLNFMIERHEVLRTSFSVASNNNDYDDSGVPQQNIHPAFPCSMELDVLTEMGKQQQQEMSDIAIKDEARKPFDLAKLPLLRTRLLQLSDDKHTLIVTMHHIIADGWSMGVVMREISALYQLSLQPKESADSLIFSQEDHSVATLSGDELLPALPIQYSDYAAWQKSSVMQSTLSEQLVYWSGKLAGANTVLDLAFDRPRGAKQSFKGDSVRFEIDASVTRKLRRISSSQDCTLYMTLLSAWAVLLYRHSGEEDILVGSPIANRNHQDIEGLIGFFVNTLAMRFDFKGNPDFTDFLAQVRQTSLDAFANQDLPFEKLVDSIQPERDLSRNPLFQVMFALQNAPAEEFGLSGLAIDVIETPRISALFDLVLDMWETEHSLIGVFEFATDLWDRSTIEHMVGQFKELLGAIAEQPVMPIKSLSILPPSERETLLHDWLGKSVSYPVHVTLQDLFQAQALSHPHRIAASHGEETITYAELNNLAGKIAEVLRLSGVVRNDIVGIYHYRGVSFLAAVMGVLKSGASFVPVDPTYPMARVRHMLADSEVRVLISSNSLLEALYETQVDEEEAEKAEKTSADLSVVLTSDCGSPALNADVLSQFTLWTHDNIEAILENYHNKGSSTDRAYMMYTSGSTGTPKGALIRHNGAVNHIFAEFDELGFHQDSVFAQSAPCSSDISIWQFLAPLMIGGSTRIIDFETVCDAAALFNEVKSVTIFEFVPIVLNEVLEFASSLSTAQRALPNLDYAMVTGEAVSVNLVNRWHQLYPEVPLCNAYGPTEAADDICQFTVDKPLPENCLRVPIGTPIANTAIYVLDKELQLLPIGVPGEICVAGIGVGEGYWKQAEKTAASFIDNPYSTGKHDKILYRTGDLGRWQASGNLEYFHRADNQVKLRGYRIELDEIEGVLFKHPSVQEVVVGLSHEAEGDQAQEQRLVAWLVVSAQNEQEEKLLQQERVSLWQSLHEDSYQGDSLHADVTFNTIGWDSTYTGEPLSDAEMHEYIDYTLELVFSDTLNEIEKPSPVLIKPRVLEIGCGTGLLMYNLLNRCESYVGTDLSDVVINRLSHQVNPNNGLRGSDVDGKTTLYCREAINFSGFEEASFDRLMLCSVVQYFPSLEYLTQTLEQAVRVVADGGKIIVGDVRNYALLRAYHTSIELFQATGGTETTALETGVAEKSLREQELTIDPSWFLFLPELIPSISFVEVLPKRGKLQNEMTRFRYDVVLHINRRTTSVDVEWQEWSHEKSTVDEIKQRLTETMSSALGWKAVRNHRIVDETRLIAWLDAGQCAENVSTIRSNLKKKLTLSIEPEDLIDLARLSGWRIHFRMADGNFAGDYDVVFIKSKGEETEFPKYPSVEQKRAREYSNNPLKEKLSAYVTPQLRAYLQNQLPAHMIPSDFVLLENLPQLPNGKIDRSALPTPPRSRHAATKPYIAPSTPLEHIIANIWCDVLGLERVGVDDNFFELGGHSLKAVQVISRFA
ncbi:MAG: amino acid adenylation domain-containing protein, partial [Porticoccaceae bacterium]